MKHFFKRNLALFLVFIFSFISSFLYYNISKIGVSKSNGYTIVIDAGHGGRDGGSVGVNGTIEKKINLDYAMLLKEKLVENGFFVVLTRSTDDGLYSNLSKNKKISDMNERMRIIKKANPNLVVSIHMNSFPDSKVWGANCYHKLDDKASMECADLIQASLNKYCGAKNVKSKNGDYYILNASYYTSVLVECGFLSNPEEENLLNTKEHKEKLVNAIYAGILLYFGKTTQYT